MLSQLLQPEVQKFIEDHRYDDPFLLSLHAKKEKDFPLKEAIEQIQSYQKAKKKLPTWSNKKNIIWPPPVSIEQASSEATAQFKSFLIQGKSLADLTGGTGIDVVFFSDRFDDLHYVEPDEHLCTLARHNFKVLGRTHIHVHHQDAESFLDKNQRHFDAIYIDPSRRSKNKRVFKLEDCSPNLYEIIPKCKSFSNQILVKLSPLVDISFLINEFQPTNIWVFSVKNEVKEVICLLQNEKNPTRIQAFDLDNNGKVNSEFKFLYHKESETKCDYSAPLKYLYEPNSAILKAGAFKSIGSHFDIKKLHPNTHLYTSNQIINNWPGKIFFIKSQLKPNKKEIRKIFPGQKVNVITRNYPLNPSQLKSRLDLKDGGDDYLIGTTLFNQSKVLLKCEQLH